MAMAWCTHCLKDCRTECNGSFMCCSTCGKINGEVTNERIPKLKKRTEKVKKKKIGAITDMGIHGSKFLIADFKEATNNNKELIQGWSMQYWCTHCLRDCRTTICNDGFISCCECGKVFGQVTVGRTSNGDGFGEEDDIFNS